MGLRLKLPKRSGVAGGMEWGRYEAFVESHPFGIQDELGRRGDLPWHRHWTRHAATATDFSGGEGFEADVGQVLRAQP